MSGGWKSEGPELPSLRCGDVVKGLRPEVQQCHPHLVGLLDRAGIKGAAVMPSEW